jgi:transcriptional regulator with XRE-family HTH domain
LEPRAVAILDGRRVRAELDRLNLTQRQFAARLGLREATISEALHDKPLATETIYRIALGLSLAEPVK